MSNGQFAALTLLVLAAHLLALGAVFTGAHRNGPMLLLNAAVALAVLVYVAAHPKAFAYGIDWQVVGLAVFEAFALGAAILAWRGMGAALIASRGVFALHLAASAAAVAFALLFRITRLI